LWIWGGVNCREERRPEQVRRRRFLLGPLFSFLFSLPVLFLFLFCFRFFYHCSVGNPLLHCHSFLPRRINPNGRRLVCWSRPSPNFSISSSPPQAPFFRLSTYLPMRHRLHRLAIFFAFALAILGQVSSLPTPAGSSTDTFYRRQAQGSPVSQSIVTQTVQTIQTCVLWLSSVGALN